MTSENSAITPDIIQHSMGSASLPPVVPPSARSGYEQVGIQDGKEVVVAAAEMINPVLGKIARYGLQTGEYSPDERLKEQQFHWLIQEVHKISTKIDQLFKELPKEEHPEAADIAATLEAAIRASRKTADSKKRKLLRNALINSFDKKQYEKGLTLRLFSILEKVEYGEILLLQELVESENNIRNLREEFSQYNDIQDKSPMANSKVKSVREKISSEKSKLDWIKDYRKIKYYHLETLIESNLIVMSRTKKPEVTELGKYFLKFVITEDIQ